ncbi:MAG: alpha/beta hydrolase, partial [Acidimicrobiia bacterium]|nr:alpha/beta hydrolase [Acidimicrobiia bacterium]
MNSEESVSAPSRWLTALEVRAVAERAAMRATTPLLRRLPSGDGHPVLVLPGFTADDRSTALLRDLLDDLGYRTHGWGLGSNIGPTSEIAAGLRDLSADLARKESQPVSVIGWSLGGIYGRELARRRPETVRQVITLGSPIQMVPGDRSAATGLWDSLRHLHDTT